ncbi:MAG: hypothetical protein JXK16_07800 [Thiotrichales bacterium]|nr:hypothetical protein [Thiotrichales bacterium]
MLSDSISNYIEGVAAKYLSEVDANPYKSNQHEIGGLVKVGFKEFLGEPAGSEVLTFEAKMLYLEDDSAVEITYDTVTWYDTRYHQKNRSAEYRLYYKNNAVTERISAQDFFLIAKATDGTLILVFTSASSTYENQLRNLFGLEQVTNSFQRGELTLENISLPLRFLLEDLGIETNIPTNIEDEWLEKLTENFGGITFPSTQDFSFYARKTLNEYCPIEEPDKSLLSWMNQEEMLFRIYEKHLVAKKLKDGFGTAGDDVDEFIHYSLSVQNRRKSRAGHAFERHLNHIFCENKLAFEQGSSKKTTENKKKPDFIFPSFEKYHDSVFSTTNLRLLGAKTSCKDRWRQVLSEGSRVEKKHLVTLEPAISESQTQEMQQSKLQLIIPSEIHASYTTNQQQWLIDLKEFISEVKTTQSFNSP